MITEEMLDEAAVRATRVMSAFAHLGWEQMGRPPGSRHRWLDGTEYRPVEAGRGSIICEDCDHPVVDHPLDGTHPGGGR